MLRILAFAMIVATGAHAQEVITGPLRLDDGVALFKDLPQVENQWSEKEIVEDADEVRRKLEGFGYDIDPQSEWLNSLDSFTLYSNSIGPGQISYLVMPNSADIPPITYSPFTGGAGAQVAQVGFTENILDAVKAYFCKMDPVPETVTGVINIQVGQFSVAWSGEDICKQ